ncbi:uncharacterized protein LY79DRAFT_86579 [Colletotrichum navitas]|uniref:Uncharacterized protein n=1 Tax=Colletotrichum navitas TaxID=681940 RepID=A0AAD8PKU0_9PEZI|nr:uncharacterized protein LY79DRAFT_86579 [Colletotrichum navitas]KAK1569436.1 hypothetical protein LY79DRAFT_86579 [Colletotrichum navitas]
MSLAGSLEIQLPRVKAATSILAEKLKSRGKRADLYNLHSETLSQHWGSLDKAFPIQFRPIRSRGQLRLGTIIVSRLYQVTLLALSKTIALPDLWKPGGWLFDAASEVNPDNSILTEEASRSLHAKLGLGGRKLRAVSHSPDLASAANAPSIIDTPMSPSPEQDGEDTRSPEPHRNTQVERSFSEEADLLILGFSAGMMTKVSSKGKTKVLTTASISNNTMVPRCTSLLRQALLLIPSLLPSHPHPRLLRKLTSR